MRMQGPQGLQSHDLSTRRWREMKMHRYPALRVAGAGQKGPPVRGVGFSHGGQGGLPDRLNGSRQHRPGGGCRAKGVLD